MSDSNNAAGKLPLTFGIEVEHLFGINKNAVCSNPAYQWLFPQYCTLDGDGPNVAAFDPTDEHHRGLLQAAKILRSKGGKVGVRLHQDSSDECFDMFCRWNLAQDKSVRFPEDANDLSEWSDGKFRDLAGWEFSGLELISPALKVPEFDAHGLLPNGLLEVDTYLGLLTQNHPPDAPYFFLSGPKVAGVHVHIGLQPQPDGQLDIPLEFLRHLAFICVAFEDTITLLHHPERHGYPYSYARGHIGSNRFVGRSPHCSFPRHYCTRGPEFSCEDAFLRIFRATDCDELVELLTTIPSQNPGELRYMIRECFVNFCNCFDFNSHSEKRTIEFRQHHGTLAIQDLAQWVVFLTALARTAERKANEAPREDGILAQSVMSKISAASASSNDGTSRDVAGSEDGVLTIHIDALWQNTVSDLGALTTIVQQASKYADLFQGKRRSLKELFDLLELPLAQRHYWWERARKFRAEWAAHWRGEATCWDYKPCKFEAVRDSEGWADGELDIPPWDADVDVPDGGAGAGAPPGGGESANQAMVIDMIDDNPPTTTTTIRGVLSSSSLSSRSPHLSRSTVMSIAAIIDHS